MTDADGPKKKRKRRSRRGRGEGSLFERPNGSWQAQITIGVSATGKQKRKAVTAETKTAVIEEMKKLHIQVSNGEITGCLDDGVTVEGYIKTWLEGRKKERALSTYESYERNSRVWVFPIIGALQLATLTKENVDTVMANLSDKKKSNRTQQIVRGVMYSAFSQAVRDKKMSSNPCEEVVRPAAEPAEFKVFDELQTQTFIRHCEDERLGTLWVTKVLTGMRIGELLALKPEDVDLRHKKIHVRRTQSITKEGGVIIKPPKTKAGIRAIALTDQCVDWLRQYKARMMLDGLGNSEWFFRDEKGGMLLRSADPKSSFNRIIAASGLPALHPHELRHTHATLLLRAGVNPKVVQERLGHSDISITLRIYSHVLPDMQFEAVNRLTTLFGPQAADKQQTG